jgi:hypothetical protein
MSHIKYAVELKRKKKLNCTLGIQMVLMPEFKDEIIPFAKLAVDLGVDYGVIKHCSDDAYGTLGVDYEKYASMYSLLDQAEQLTNEQTKVVVTWDMIKESFVGWLTLIFDLFPLDNYFGLFIGQLFCLI